jgi:asparagine synthase (glutamine-hydrolysing)
MCGIFGQFTSTATASRETAVACALSAQRLLAHRGPDDRGVEEILLSVGTLTLGHTRLSIIDLSKGGHQPMRSPDGRYVLVFNGEIYNYRELRHELQALGHSFSTESDSEVLLAAWVEWGQDGLRRLKGMFAFAVIDKATQCLTLVRDPFGIKPLYYHLEEEMVCFASEVPALCALLPHPPAPDLATAYAYLAFGAYDNGERTFFDSVQQLPPAHCLTIDLRSPGESKAVRWWWPRIAEHPRVPLQEAAARLRNLFIDSVRLHLRSDVPVGAALSGGIDSSAIVCAMRLAEPDMPLHTFTFVAPGSPVDEERWADLVNGHVGAIVHKVEVNPDELARDLDAMIRAQGEPFGSTSIYAQYRVYRAAREAGIVVTLDGQGADELLAGYDGFPSGAIASLLERRRIGAALGLSREWSRWPGRTLSGALRALASGARTAWLPKAARSVRVPGRSRPPWLHAGRCRELGLDLPPERGPYGTEARQRRLVEQLRAALAGKGLAALLRHGDRNSMSWSIESRVPFLTMEIAEFCLGLPEEFLLSLNGETKCVFRAAMRGIVPDAVLDRRDKIGFRTPEDTWLRAQGALLVEWISDADRIPILDPAACHREVSDALAGDTRFTPGLWRLVNYCRWIQLCS